ncbi:bifunctional adenosylcobinamide kinase/adenosylcobinamide-phosphate guanylyltransferase [Microscilla marina]|uniref:Adenosylcobinamide kinase n=1 Tax=Microscilla marina ATCC 23134 TaxID=313606 RepID=A1ZF06_MICM2|nr:bifunctional adenosylcobinamide kinase/adenosylcobinamide-phosphate guanylyltransferase [Microscilla marina]EAY31108.1 cobinamide kinase [Microscilla marina ATCC 23134]
MAYIYYVSGGQRSGKSSYAQRLALQLSAQPVYLATSRVWDKDHQRRIERHQADRNEQWVNVEEEKYISKHNWQDQVVVMDCVTLWLTNFFSDTQYNVDQSLKEAQQEFDLFIQQEFTGIIISNEIGMGLHADTEAGRKFTDLQGWMNQYIARKADQAIFMVSGLPLTVK